jgi:hypothetical protein
MDLLVEILRDNGTVDEVLIEAGIYGSHPVYAKGGDVGAEQHLIHDHFFRKYKFDKTIVWGAGDSTVYVAIPDEQLVARELVKNFGYTFKRKGTRGAILANQTGLLAHVATTRVGGGTPDRLRVGVKIDLEDPRLGAVHQRQVWR